MDSIDQEIMEALKKQMPAKMFEATKEKIAENDKMVVRIKELERKVDNQDDQIANLTAELGEHGKLDVREKAVIEKEADIKKRKSVLWTKELEMTKKEMEYQLDAEKSKSQFCKEVALGLVRNIEFRKNVYSNGNVPIETNGCITNGCKDENTTETTTAE